MFKGLLVGSIAYLFEINRIKSENAILPSNIFKTAGTDNAVFYIDENINTINEVITEYKFDDLRPTDNVLDIGACIGAFSLNVCKRVNHVYAVEPLMINELKKNIELNNAKNITILDCALGSGLTNVKWNNNSRNINAISLREIIELCNNKIDFIKCDCEGGEWSFTLLDIFNIRRIEAEVHNFSGSYNFKDFENLLISSGFDYTKNITNRNTMIISAKNRYII